LAKKKKEREKGNPFVWKKTGRERKHNTEEEGISSGGWPRRLARQNLRSKTLSDAGRKEERFHVRQKGDERIVLGSKVFFHGPRKKNASGPKKSRNIDV